MQSERECSCLAEQSGWQACREVRKRVDMLRCCHSVACWARHETIEQGEKDGEADDARANTNASVPCFLCGGSHMGGPSKGKARFEGCKLLVQTRN
jgi:hypothetical protein